MFHRPALSHGDCDMSIYRLFFTESRLFQTDISGSNGLAARLYITSSLHLTDFRMGPQRKHSDFFKSNTSRQTKAPSTVPTSSANLSDSSFDRLRVDSDMLPESGIDMLDIQEPRSSVCPPDAVQIQQRKAWAWNHGFLDDIR